MHAVVLLPRHDCYVVAVLLNSKIDQVYYIDWHHAVPFDSGVEAEPTDELEESDGEMSE